LLLTAGLAAGQFPESQFPRGTGQEEEKRLPNGKLQSEEILKADYQANLKDLEKMKKLVEGVEADLTKSKGNVLSMQAIRNLEELEKMAKRVRGRMQRF